MNSYGINFDDSIGRSRQSVEAAQNIVFISVFSYALTEKNRSFNFAKMIEIPNKFFYSRSDACLFDALCHAMWAGGYGVVARCVWKEG